MTTTVHKNTTEAGLQITRDNLHWGSTLGAAAGPISFGFRISAAGYTVNNHDTSDFSTLTASEQVAARAALGFWSAAANITFTDLGNSNNATIEFANYRDLNDGSEAFAFFPTAGNANTSAASNQGDVFINTAFASTTNDSPGTYEFLTFIHEIGHALGLEHPGAYNAAAGVKITYEANAEYIEDTHQYSVMSYFGENFTGANYFGINPETPMLDDIAAIQRLYGANTNTATGSTTYGFNSNAGSPYSITSSLQSVVFTVWDAGGTDTFDFSGYSQTQTINLNAESFSSVGGLTSNVAIARGVTIESAIGGSGIDTIIGNAADNTLRGGLGDDSIDGGGGTDSAVFSGQRSAYTLTALSGNGVRVTGPDGTDTLTNVERLVFNDQTVTWPPSNTDDYADSFTDTTAPFGQVAVNGSSTGALEVGGDRDWFRVQLTAGTNYTIDLQGADFGAGTLTDPYLYLHNSIGTLLTQNDDIVNGVNHDSRLTFTATTTGTYYLEAGAFGDNLTGTYRVSVTGATNADDFADSLTDTTAPFGTVTVNGSSTGRLEVTGDRDWFRVQLVAGTNYAVNLQGLQAGFGTLEDPYIRVHGSSGVLVAENDDIVLGVNRDSQLTFTATTTGSYYLEAGSFDDDYTGTYKVSISGTTNGDDFADSLTDTTAPFGTVTVNGSSTGRLEVTGDRDWFRVQLVAGTNYAVNLQGQQAGAGSLEDPYLRIHDSSGALVAENDDIVLGINRDSQLTYTAATTGTYYIEAGAFIDNYTGTYKLSISSNTAGHVVIQHGGAFNPTEAQYADVNGDGRADQIYQGQDNRFWVSLSNGNGFTAPSQWMQHGGAFSPGEAQYADVNADGRADLIYQGQDNRFWVSLSTGNGFGAASQWMQHGGSYSPGEAQYADVNGDGRADLIYQGQDNRFWVSLSNGAGFGAASQWMQHGGSYSPGEAQYADVNGDGRADLIYQGQDNRFWVSLSNGAGFGAASQWMQHGGSYMPGEAQYADLNGDGRADLIYQGQDNRFWVSLSNGAGFGAPQQWMQHGGNFVAGEAQYADLNNDGKKDLIFDGVDNQIWASRSTGAGFAAPQQIGQFAGSFIAGALHVVDVDADHRADLMMQNVLNQFLLSHNNSDFLIA